ncbi:MAG: hypothetical protein LH679_14715 [Cyanobacteria bacterium CAN_BIN43]|nr:hypothetical protein [Cyanobacteria bacterium CAN_BIN43]
MIPESFWNEAEAKLAYHLLHVWLFPKLVIQPQEDNYCDVKTYAIKGDRSV